MNGCKLRTTCNRRWHKLKSGKKKRIENSKNAKKKEKEGEKTNKEVTSELHKYKQNFPSKILDGSLPPINHHLSIGKSIKRFFLSRCRQKACKGFPIFHKYVIF